MKFFIRKFYKATLILSIFFGVLSSCLKLETHDQDVSLNPGSNEPINFKNEGSTFKNIRFSEQSSLNFMTEVQIKLGNDFSYPIGSYVVLKDQNEIIFLGKIESKKQIMNFTVPYNLKKLEVQVVSETDGVSFLKKFVNIEDGVLVI